METPAACAAATARATVATNSAAARGGSGVPSRRPARVPPGQNPAPCTAPVCLADLEDLDDVRMLEACHRLCLSPKPDAQSGICRGVWHFQSHKPIRFNLAAR